MIVFCQINRQFVKSFVLKWKQLKFSTTSMLLMDVGDEMCWWQVLDVGDHFVPRIKIMLPAFKIFNKL